MCEEALTLEEQQVALTRLRLEGALDQTQPELGSEPTPVPPAPAKPLLTIAEVAELLTKSKQAVYKMAERGQLAGVTRIGGRLYVRRADLLRSFAEGRVPSPGRSR